MTYAPIVRSLTVSLVLAATHASAIAQSLEASKPVGATPSQQLPHDLSPWGMFLGADLIVKSVLIGLVFASFVTWTIALAKAIEIISARRRAQRAIAGMRRAASLSETRQRTTGIPGVVAILVEAAVGEIERSGTALPAAGIKERIASHFQRIEAGEVRRIQRGTGFLATIGATAPFVGLFGTVWGIMNSFIGISKAHTTNLAVVAPGIAEALLATAIGLAAAIPAVVVYNFFARGVAGYRALVADAAAEVLRSASRDLDRLAASGDQGGRAASYARAAE